MSQALVSGNAIGKYVEYWRKQRKLTQVELAAILSVEHGIGMERATISQIESGARAVKDKEVIALCAVLEITPNELFGA